MRRRLSELVDGPVPLDPDITGVTADSRKVKPGALFAALPGGQADGRAFIPAALAAGAVAVIAPDDTPDCGAPLIRARDPRRAYALAAARFWGLQPRCCVAVTGTNGKTSVAAFTRQIFERLGHEAASMGTLGVRHGKTALTPPGLTTPDAADVARLLAELSGRGVTHLALEASSHGLDQRRLDGVVLAAAGFTNFTQDHLDYHGGMDRYLQAKLRLFEALLPRGRTTVLNADSPAFKPFADTAIACGHVILSVGAQGQTLKLVERSALPHGQHLQVEAGGRLFEIQLPLAGGFQVENALVAAGLCIAAGEELELVLGALGELEGAPGRLQHVGRGADGGEAYVDYAHTPDGLESVLSALRPHARGRLIVVFGAGGDRDRAKRPLMGAAAVRGADIAIVTDDNPRTESPAAIRAEILAGAPGAIEIGDRRRAIRHAAAMLRAGDVLVIAGKGHEQGQTVGAEVLPFDDVTETASALREPAHV
ncbi:MAG: UDP-N-acetylmuramoyl-L-alanyl-D-glutamate--2,6-diaminopimelate ligase [Pseudomonadota bacterium]|nr:UDP-N-acetylmuramoyl-L-alanyl-D-glutamate--2,6-diaminopimelate ligase [Pseudomonadota bacterium]